MEESEEFEGELLLLCANAATSWQELQIELPGRRAATLFAFHDFASCLNVSA